MPAIPLFIGVLSLFTGCRGRRPLRRIIKFIVGRGLAPAAFINKLFYGGTKAPPYGLIFYARNLFFWDVVGAIPYRSHKIETVGACLHVRGDSFVFMTIENAGLHWFLTTLLTSGVSVVPAS